MAGRFISADARDYVITSGSLQKDTTHASEVYMRIATRRGSIKVPGFENFGSRLHTIKKNARGSDVRAQAFVREAIADLISSGAIRNVEIDAIITSVPGVGAAIEVSVSFSDTDGDPRIVRYTASN